MKNNVDQVAEAITTNARVNRIDLEAINYTIFPENIAFKIKNQIPNPNIFFLDYYENDRNDLIDLFMKVMIEIGLESSVDIEKIKQMPGEAFCIYPM